MNTNVISITTEMNDIPNLSTTIWFSGCKLDCAGCHNTILEDFTPGFSLDEVEELLIERRKMTDWLVYLGGNPLDSIDDVLSISKIAKKLGFNQFLYSGYTFLEFKSMFSSEIHTELIHNFDYIKTGRFDPHFMKEKCCDIGQDYFFATVNQEVYKSDSDDNVWDKFYNFNLDNQRIQGQMSQL